MSLRDMDSFKAYVADAFGLDELSLDAYIDIADGLGLDSELLKKNLGRVVSEAMLFWLIGRPRASMTYYDRVNLITKHLRSAVSAKGLPSREDEKLVVLAKKIAEHQFSISQSSKSREVRSVNEFFYQDIMEKQGNRCDICGVPFVSTVVREHPRAPNGVEEVVAPQLDHILPYSIFGNSTEFRYLCGPCNSMKGALLGLQEDGVLLCGNVFLNHGMAEKRSFFWALSERTGCQFEDCSRNSRDSLLLTGYKNPAKPKSFWNVGVFCLDHALEGSIWLHE